MSTTDTAIAHKDYDVRGGGEVLAEELARTFDAPLYVGHANEANHPSQPDIDIHEICPQSHLHRLMDRTGTAVRGLAHMIHWRDHAPADLAEYSTVVTSGNEPLWWQSRDDQTVVAYTHSTPRYMYDLHSEISGFIARTYNQLQRRLYEGRVKDVDVWVANSDLVARRIRKYWNIPREQITTVYPPVATGEYSPDDRATGEYYLYLGRLDHNKKVEMVVDAFNYRDDDVLRIAGKGPLRDTLEARAGDNIRFEGYVSEREKQRLYAGAKALVYPAQNEDFGMVPVEAMSAGTPVIGVREGFTRFQIQDGRNGYTFERTVPQLHRAVSQFARDGVAWRDREIADWAGRYFSVDRFREEMEAVVDWADRRTQVSPPWMDDDQGDAVEELPAVDAGMGVGHGD